MIKLSADTSLLAGLAGGVLIALSSSSLLYFTGNILGVSGIMGKLLNSKAAWNSWRFSFLVGMLGAGRMLAKLQPDLRGPWMMEPEMIAVAGVLVGLGTRLANGCTSGHGVCGLPRRSLRSFVAVCTFMTTGAVTAYLARVDPQLEPRAVDGQRTLATGFVMSVAAVVLGTYAFRHSWAVVKPADTLSTLFAGGLCGAVFGLGLGISGMTKTQKVLGFLDFTNSSGWDPSLAAVMAGAVLINLLTFQSFSHISLAPPCGSTDCVGRPLNDLITMGNKAPNLKIDFKLIGGSALFGVGWGLTGMCPGPVLVNLGAGQSNALLAFPSIAVGMALHDLLF